MPIGNTFPINFNMIEKDTFGVAFFRETELLRQIQREKPRFVIKAIPSRLPKREL